MDARFWPVGAAVACIGLLSASSLQSPPRAAAATPMEPVAVDARLARLPLEFERNLGQADPSVRYLARGPGYSLLLKQDGALLGLRGDETAFVGMTLHGGNPRPAIEGEGRRRGRSHYLVGPDQGGWRQDVPHFGQVRYRAVYPGIDLAFYGNQRQLEYDFIVAPGAHPDAIAIEFDGIRALRIDARGDLVLETAGGPLVQRKPVVYQSAHGARRPVEGRYRLLAGNRVGFALGRYDRTLPLVIDPVVAYSSYLGGSGADHISSMGMDAEGNVYVAGYTESLDFPVRKAAQTAAHGSGDVFVAKFDLHGDGMVYSTYLGGSGEDRPFSIEVDEAGNAVLAGTTYSTDFPVRSALQPAHAADSGQADAWVARLGGSGTLVFSTYLGGSADDEAYGVTLDGDGRVWLAGRTGSADFPVEAPVQADKQAGSDAFLARLSADGARLEYATYLGGGGEDFATAVGLDPDGRAYVVGETRSTDFPTVPAGSRSGSDADAFLAVVSSGGDALDYSRYIGGSGDDRAFDLTVDDFGAAHIVGRTASTDFPTWQAMQPTPGGGTDGFIFQIEPGKALLQSTYVGGSGGDELREVGMAGGLVVAVGSTRSPDLPLLRPLQPALNRGRVATGCAATPCSDALLIRYTKMSYPMMATYVGGSGDDFGWAVGARSRGDFYIGGATGSSDLAQAGSAQAHPGGAGDAFLMRIAPIGMTEPGFDFDADWGADLLWRNPVTGANAIWLQARRAKPLPVASLAGPWSPTVGDFDCDRRSDILWREPRLGGNQIWLAGNASNKRAVAATKPGWRAVATGDFDERACNADVLWRNTATGENVVWPGANPAAYRVLTSVTNPDWEVAGIGGFEPGGWNNDILWHNQATGASVIWRDGHAAWQKPVTRVTNVDWRIAGIGDFNNDGISDILWHNPRTGASIIWRTGDSRRPQLVTTVTNLDWDVATVGDYNLDGRSDILWRNRRTGANVAWLSASSSHQMAVTAVTNTDWSPVR